jgi:hypothetical protein
VKCRHRPCKMRKTSARRPWSCAQFYMYSINFLLFFFVCKSRGHIVQCGIAGNLWLISAWVGRNQLTVIGNPTLKYLVSTPTYCSSL